MGTQDTGRRQTKQGAIKYRRSRDTGNIGYTRHRTKTNKTRGNPSIDEDLETLATLGTQDTGRRQTKQGAIKYRRSTKTNKTGQWQRNWQHWVHKTQDEDKQNKGQ